MPLAKIVSSFISCALALGLAEFNAPPSRAAEGTVSATVLEGDWVRVLDGCADLPIDQVLKFAETGGGNRVSRSQILSFRSETYRSHIKPAPRCHAGFEPTGPDISAAAAECSGGESMGTVTVTGDHHLTLSATRNTGSNNWAAAFRSFDFEIFNDQVLFLHGGEPISYCPDANQRIYFIRSPDT